MKRLPVFALVALISISAACNKKDDEKKKKHHSEDAGALQLNLVVASAADSNALRLTDPPVLADFTNWSIASGAPETFNIKITNISLQKGTYLRPIFDEPEGRELRIDGSYVDLSSLFTTFACINADGQPVDTGGAACPCGLDATNTPIAQVNGECPKPAEGTAFTPPVGLAAVPVHEYDTVRVTFLTGAKIKGCVSGNFRTGVTHEGLHTYCTRAALSTFNNPIGSGNDDDFLQSAGAAEEMDFSIQGDLTKAKTETFTLDFPISGGITIDANTPQKLTLAIDTNRMLRYSNPNRPDVNNGTRSYFFTSVFPGSIFVFVGEPGVIRGYSWVTSACNVAPSVPDDHICTPKPNGTDYDPFTVAGWLTMIFDKDGNPIVASSTPDDDGTLTVMKGSNTREGTGLTPGDVTAATTEGKWNVILHLNDQPFNIFNVPGAIDVGTDTTDAYFDSLVPADSTYRYGTVRFTRGL